MPEQHKEGKEQYPAYVGMESVNGELLVIIDTDQEQNINSQDIICDSADNARDEQDEHPL